MDITRDELQQLISGSVEVAVNKAINNCLHGKIHQSSERLSLKEAVKFLANEGYETSESSLYKKSSSGDIPGYKVAGRLCFYRKDLIQWIERNEKKCSPLVAVQCVTQSANRKLRRKHSKLSQ